MYVLHKSGAGQFILVAQAIAARSAMVTYLACGQQLAPNLTRLTSDGIHPTAAGATQGNPTHTLVHCRKRNEGAQCSPVERTGASCEHSSARRTMLCIRQGRAEVTAAGVAHGHA